MKRFIATLRDGSYINIPADTMKLQGESYLFAYANGELVGYIDIDCAVSAHISEGGTPDNKLIMK